MGYFLTEFTAPLAYVKSPLGSTSFIIGTALDPSSLMGSIRGAVRQVDDSVIIDMSTQTDQIERRFIQERVFAVAYALSVSALAGMY